MACQEYHDMSVWGIEAQYIECDEIWSFCMPRNLTFPRLADPLHLAAWLGVTELVQVLISTGADPNSRDAHGETALHEASVEGHTETARVLINAGAETGDDSCHPHAIRSSS